MTWKIAKFSLNVSGVAIFGLRILSRRSVQVMMFIVLEFVWFALSFFLARNLKPVTWKIAKFSLNVSGVAIFGLRFQVQSFCRNLITGISLPFSNGVGLPLVISSFSFFWKNLSWLAMLSAANLARPAGPGYKCLTMLG